MTIEQLKYFAAVEQCTSFSWAAEQLYTSQSTISKQIKALEKELGFALFLRTTRRVEVTEAGRLFSPYAKRILAEYSAMRQATRWLAKKESAAIRLLSIPVIAQYGLIEVFSKFSGLYPHIHLQIEEQNADVVLQELSRGAADIAILRSIHPRFQALHGLQSVPIIWDEICLLVNGRHPLAAQEEVPLRALARETFCFLSTHTGISSFCMAECAKAGFIPYIQQAELSRYSLQTVIETQSVVSLMARKVAEAIVTPNIRIISLKEHPKLDLSFAVREDSLNENLSSLMHHVIVSVNPKLKENAAQWPGV